MKDQMLIDKYNELGKAHIETVNQLAKKAQEEIDKLKKVSGSLSGTRIKGDRK